MADKELIRERFAAGFERYDTLALVQQEICDELAGAVMRHVPRTVARALEVGAGTGFLTRRLVEYFPRTAWVFNDLAPASREYVGRYTGGVEAQYLWGDAETAEFPPELDLLVSASTVQWFDDLPRFLGKSFAALRRGGFLALSTFGPDNFSQIRALTGEGLCYYAPDALSALVRRAGFTLLWQRACCRTLWFSSPVEVLRHIRETGVNATVRRSWTPRRLREFCEEYGERFASSDRDGRVPLTYHPVLLVARKG